MTKTELFEDLVDVCGGEEEIAINLLLERVTENQIREMIADVKERIAEYEGELKEHYKAAAR